MASRVSERDVGIQVREATSSILHGAQHSAKGRGPSWSPSVGSGKISVRTDVKSKSYSTAVLKINFKGATADTKTCQKELQESK